MKICLVSQAALSGLPSCNMSFPWTDPTSKPMYPSLAYHGFYENTLKAGLTRQALCVYTVYSDQDIKTTQGCLCVQCALNNSVHHNQTWKDNYIPQWCFPERK